MAMGESTCVLVIASRTPPLALVVTRAAESPLERKHRHSDSDAGEPQPGERQDALDRPPWMADVKQNDI